MSMFKNHKIGVNQLLSFIPEALLAHLSTTTKVDYYSKVLQGQKIFYLLLYGILENEKLSQRSLEDTFNDPVFKTLFELNPSESVRHSSISERLSKIEVGYFQQIYEHIYEQFSNLYVSSQQSYRVMSVDSSMVSEAAGKLLEGLDNKSGKKSVKYSFVFDGLLPCSVELFTKNTYQSEDIALPEVIKAHIKQETHHQNIYVIDRGLQSTRTLQEFSRESVCFVCRAKENRKYVELESISAEKQDMGENFLLKDAKVQLYTGIPIRNKRGNIHYQEELVTTPFRLIIFETKINKKTIWLITNNFELSPLQITQIYRQRWNIEVFFRFIKQELNFSHLIALNKNGIEVMLYMTLIVAMLLLIYKEVNHIGYKTAKRRMAMEIRNLAIALIVMQCGGDPNKLFKT